MWMHDSIFSARCLKTEQWTCCTLFIDMLKIIDMQPTIKGDGKWQNIVQRVTKRNAMVLAKDVVATIEQREIFEPFSVWNVAAVKTWNRISDSHHIWCAFADGRMVSPTILLIAHAKTHRERERKKEGRVHSFQFEHNDHCSEVVSTSFIRAPDWDCGWHILFSHIVFVFILHRVHHTYVYAPSHAHISVSFFESFAKKIVRYVRLCDSFISFSSCEQGQVLNKRADFKVICLN